MDKKLLQQFYETFRQELYLYLCSLCHDSQLAEDLLQETFLKAILSLQDSHTNVRAWMYLVARNLYFNHIKKERYRFSVERRENYEAAFEQDVLEKIILNEQKWILYQALNHLEITRREVLLLQYFAGFSQKEIAAMLHLTPENVRVLAYRGKRELKKYMEGNGYELS